MPRPRGEPKLSRERIVTSALRLVDREGLDGLSMRKLARELSVDPMSIYHHIANKEALLRALVEYVFRSMPVPEGRGDWKRRVRSWAGAYLGVAAAHPNLVLRIVSDPATVAVAAAHVSESLYSAIEASGLPPRSVVGAADLIVDYVNGYSLAYGAPISPDVDAIEAYRSEIQARAPEQSATQRRLLIDSDLLERREGFEFGLDIILRGIDQLRRHASRSGSRPRRAMR